MKPSLKIRWEAAFEGSFWAQDAPCLSQEGDLVIRFGKSIFGLDPETGHRRWSTLLDPATSSTGEHFTPYDDVFVTDFRRGPTKPRLTSIVAANSAGIRWRVDFDAAIVIRGNVVLDGDLLWVVAHSVEGEVPKLIALRLTDGGFVHERPLPLGSSKLLLANDHWVISRHVPVGLYRIPKLGGQEETYLPDTPVWCLRGSGQHIALTAAETNKGPFTLELRDTRSLAVRWSVSTPHSELGVPPDAVVYFDGDELMPVMKRTDGHIIWRGMPLEADGKVNIHDDVVVFREDELVEVYSRRDGCYVGSLEADFGYSELVHEGHIYVGTDAGIICAALG